MVFLLKYEEKKGIQDCCKKIQKATRSGASFDKNSSVVVKG
jgi:hypothetical protein